MHTYLEEKCSEREKAKTYDKTMEQNTEFVYE